jgi:hypothetical protein
MALEEKRKTEMRESIASRRPNIFIMKSTAQRVDGGSIYVVGFKGGFLYERIRYDVFLMATSRVQLDLILSYRRLI